jgi:ubiquinone/menaquinone biosynthesis C-methylase UbiE
VTDTSRSRATREREEILDRYYREVFTDLHHTGAQSQGIDMMTKSIETVWQSRNPAQVLEVGFSSGEHLPHVKDIPTQRYVGLDLFPNRGVSPDGVHPDLMARLEIVQGDVQDMSLFEDNTFDRVLSTCLLLHLTDPLAALYEIRRVTRVGGEISIVTPTESGMLHRIVRQIFVFRKMRKMTDLDPLLVRAVDHPNSFQAIMSLVEYAFRDDDLTISYGPFHVGGYNCNLWSLVHVVKK